jgi:ribosome maturation factor RimP
MESVPKKNLDHLTGIAVKAAEELGLVILRLTARGTPSRAIIEVTLDRPKLVAISDCEIVSKKLNEAIEAESLIGGNFRLDVLSPGLDEPIVHDYQFQRTIGHLIEVSFEEEGKKTSVLGKLEQYSLNELVVVKRQTKRGGDVIEVHIPRNHILSVFARPDFGN